MYRLVAFDLDGTVLDTMEDLAAAINASRVHAGLCQQDPEFLRSTVGNGIRRCIERSTAGEEADREEIYRFFSEYYPGHCLDNTFEYDGMTDMLQRLKNAGIKTAIYTNKPHVPAVKLINARFEGLFDEIRGAREGVPIKPDPGVLYEIMERFSVKPSETLYVGDSEVDIMTGKNAGVGVISVTWGFKTPAFLSEHGAERMADTPKELGDIIFGYEGEL